MQPIPLSDQIPVPTFTHPPQIDDEYSASSSDLSQDQLEDSEFQMSDSSLDRRSPFDHRQLNDLVRDLYLPEQSAELRTSRLQEKNLLHEGKQCDILSEERRRDIKVFYF